MFSIFGESYPSFRIALTIAQGLADIRGQQVPIALKRSSNVDPVVVRIVEPRLGDCRPCAT